MAYLVSRDWIDGDSDLLWFYAWACENYIAKKTIPMTKAAFETMTTCFQRFRESSCSTHGSCARRVCGVIVLLLAEGRTPTWGSAIDY